MIQPTATLANPTVQLSEAQLEPELERCPLCGRDRRRRLFPIQHDPDVWLLECLDCRGASASRMPTAETLTAYYAGYYDDERSDTLGEDGVTIVGAERLARRVARELVSVAPRQASILDFGGGDGSIALLLARELLDRGSAEAEVTVVDRHELRGTRANEPITLMRHDSLEGSAGRTFDVVLASGVLEHVPRPVELLRSLNERMAPGATFYARTPYEAPLIRAARRFGMRPELGYPGHLHDLGQRFWEGVGRLPGLASFTLIRSRPSIVATGLRSHPLRTLAAYALKAPNAWFGRSWGFVGGWEVIATRQENVR